MDKGGDLHYPGGTAITQRLGSGNFDRQPRSQLSGVIDVADSLQDNACVCSEQTNERPDIFPCQGSVLGRTNADFIGDAGVHDNGDIQCVGQLFQYQLQLHLFIVQFNDVIACYYDRFWNLFPEAGEFNGLAVSVDLIDKSLLYRRIDTSEYRDAGWL